MTKWQNVSQKGMVLVLRQNMVGFPRDPQLSVYTKMGSAELRGPGARGRFQDSEDDYGLDIDQHNRGLGGRAGRIILLGDGTEVLTDSDETEMFDHDAEDKDVEAHVTKGQTQSTEDQSERRNEREETPAPQPKEVNELQRTPETVDSGNPFDTPSSTASEKSEPTEMASIPAKKINMSAIPSKLENPSKPTEN